MKKTNKRRDKLADWIFCRLMDILNDQNREIVVVFKRLARGGLEKDGKTYNGQIGQKDIVDDGTQLITIDPQISKRSKMRVFCHELLHILFEDIDDEKPIENLEHLLWPQLSESQKQMLGDYMYSLVKK
ncbi:MAG: hypothetical protein US71_C0008G0003 [Parcubacteria group bacterium GW2011_GWD2_38_12]|uniref:IrrE N-terminal-like domain-containing protein n=1 Tax=Candidatus Azambacteria bacterium RIFCSPLOWO2_01_FULL_37_9 TaxID=1797297 RepID=A0A1F5C7H9_9BACT|nr:MAG: hypothetical protein US71_C0008G0003 [Parcubacteria group bacterium GW2011_GWD2_38_12]KKQ58203.1 MAG: hypothetical protein US79_C0011G0014 [Parcubacteria group bacterium GW2011_GWC1_38_17]OGD38800.1 MAG: hypothetical protein A2907_00530 [Candidatus Azambacteria bacterium RIFCSPLOWO2_01_FULL_37_9]